jgi:hypothetical protein
MFRFYATFVSLSLLISMTAFSCENHEKASFVYPMPENHLDREVDGLLTAAEEQLFANSFKEALTSVERAEHLIPLTTGERHYRKLRSLFDKAVIVTCIEGPNDKSYSHFAELSTLLASKSCANGTKPQPNLFDKNGHWPILGENTPISIEECRERVDTTAKSLEIAAAALQVHPATRMTIATAIYTITRQAKHCCTQDGFWKTCIQPVVDTWKRAELLGIPPDPAWD